MFKVICKRNVNVKTVLKPCNIIVRFYSDLHGPTVPPCPAPLPLPPPAPQVRAILADVEDRLRDWSPAALGMKAPMDREGNAGATSCLCCDNRVCSVRDLKTMGFMPDDKCVRAQGLGCRVRGSGLRMWGA